MGCSETDRPAPKPAGTELQPGVNLLERAGDFPADAPILVITDAPRGAVLHVS